MARLKQDFDVRRSIHLPSIVTKDKYKDESDYCQICRLRNKRRLAEFYCSNCAMPMCPSCREVHTETRVTADHVIVNKKEQDVSSHTCTVHRFASVQYFCDTCLQLVCVNCTMIEHRNHVIVGIAEKAQQSRTQLEDTIRELDNKLGQFSGELSKIEETERNLDKNREQLVAEINQKVAQLLQVLNQQQEELIKQVNKYMDDKTKSIKNQKALLEKRYQIMATTRSAIDASTVGYSNEDVIEKAVNVQQDIMKLQDPFGVDVQSVKFLRFHMTNDGVLGSMGESDDLNGTIPLSSRLGLAKIPVIQPPVVKKVPAVKRSHDFDDNASEPIASPTRTVSVARLPRSQPAGQYEYRNHAQNLRIVNRFKSFSYVQNPSGVAVLPNGKYVIADAANYGVILCDKSGRWQQRLFQEDVAFPSGVVVNRDGEIAIATHKYVKVYRPDGIKVRQFSVPATTISALAMDDYGHYVVMDQGNKQLIVYDEDGMELRTIHPIHFGSMKPASHILALGGDHIALSYQPHDMGGMVKLYNYRGDELKSCELPNPCKGIQMDRFGNMIISCGDLMYVPAKGNEIMTLSVADKKGNTFQLSSRCVTFTPQGLICTLHSNRMTQRSELIILHLG